ncbi:MAG: ParB/RepB/Spo0J family partition protein [Propioniciclava sp.]|uniref:ParB/RepB/Spo0J family partition protein n=1 Tax=Propioniciclava sp. TaxID=2038686 RepID=UPI0039E4EFA8
MSAPRQRSGLGRGLGDLIRPTTVDVSPPARVAEDDPQDDAALVPAPAGAAFVELDVDAIAANPKQPRQVFDEDDLGELVESIREVGLLQPVVVRRVGDGYELVMGERRLRATRRAGLATIPAIVRDTADHDLLRDALLENLHRVQLNPLEEAAAYQQMLDDFDCTQDELATRIKRSRPQISNTIRLLRLPGPVQRRVAAGVLSAGHARALLGLTDPVDQERLAQRIVAEGLSVRTVEEIVSMGQHEQRARRRTVPRTPSPRASHLAEVLTDSFDTRVNVQIGKTKGRITIEFAGEEDLDRILVVLREGVSTQA